MKLRIQDNSVRLRLTRPEVDRLHSSGDVSAVASFPGGSALRYAVRSTIDSDAVSASLDAQAIVVSIPAGQIHAWAESEEVSIRGREALQGDAVLDILVEKDFACLAPRPGEDESDKFHNPREGQAC